MTSTSPDPSPGERLLEILFGFMTTQAIAVAAKLGVADLLKDGPRSAEDLARATGADPRALSRVLRSLAGAGIFAVDGSGRFRLTPLAEPLRQDAPGTLRDFAVFMGADFHWQTWGGLEETVRSARPAFERRHGKAFFDYLPDHAEEARIFHDAMTSLSAWASGAVAAAYDFSGFAKLVDVGGGHGLLLATILRKYVRLRGVLFDAPAVVAGAKGLLGEPGLAGRLEAAGGDFFQSVPAGGSACILKHIIHDWDDERAVTILRNCHRALAPRGKVLIVEMVLPEGNAPHAGRFIDLEMLVFLHSHERTERQYGDLLQSAGFRPSRVVPTATPYSIVEGERA
jgi:SAM-dependent methyltransferase/DNA-binding transcriptional ArsR family regulator